MTDDRCKETTCLMQTQDGHCSGLADTDFKGKPCPFYKDTRKLKATEIRRYLNRSWAKNFPPDPETLEKTRAAGRKYMQEHGIAWREE